MIDYLGKVVKKPVGWLDGNRIKLLKQTRVAKKRDHGCNPKGD
jgi:hypothetical protein